MYRIFIKQKDRQKAINIILKGIKEYLPETPKDYLKEHGVTNTSDVIDTSEIYADDKKIAFTTEIANEDELLNLMIDGRKKCNKIAIYWDANYFTADDLIGDI